VADLVDAHIESISLDKSATINLGTGKGVSVLELIRITEQLSKKKLNYDILGRRDGDPDKLVASSKLAKELMGWESKVSIGESIKSMLKVYGLI